MKDKAFTVLRLGIGITFLWIGMMIWRQPTIWGAMIQPWAAALLPAPLEQMMVSTAILDMLVGALLIVNIFTWPAALLGTIHLIIVLITVGIDGITVRDIGLMFATFAIAMNVWPATLKEGLRPKR